MEKKEENSSKSKETVSQNKHDGVSLHVLIMGCDKTANNTYEKAYINNKIMDYLYEELFNYILMARGTKSVKFTVEFKNDKIKLINTETTPPKKE
jgi:predicted SpoU family rRNA methylase